MTELCPPPLGVSRQRPAAGESSPPVHSPYAAPSPPPPSSPPSAPPLYPLVSVGGATCLRAAARAVLNRPTVQPPAAAGPATAARRHLRHAGPNLRRAAGHHQAGPAAGETLILLHPPPPFSRRFNTDEEGMSVKCLAGGQQAGGSEQHLRGRDRPERTAGESRLTAAIPMENPYCSCRLTRATRGRGSTMDTQLRPPVPDLRVRAELLP